MREAMAGCGPQAVREEGQDRWNRFRFLLILCVLTVPVRIFGQPEEDLREQLPVVRDLVIEGNRSISRGAITLLMSTRETPWYDWFPGVKSRRFDPAAFRTDVTRIVSYYQNQGFFDVGVDTTVVRTDAGVRVTVRIREGEQVHVSGVRLEGVPDRLQADSLRVRKGLSLRPGRALTRASVEGDQAFLMRQLQDMGYAFARVSTQVDIKPDHKAHVVLRATPGNRYLIEGVLVEGNKGVSPGLVRRGLTFKPGELYRKGELLNSQRQLYRSGVFRSVSLSVPDSAGRDGTGAIPVMVSVTERPLRSLRVGAGYDTEEDLKGSLELVHRSFLGGGRQARLATQLTSLNSEATVGLRQPYVWDNRSWLNLGGFIERERREDFERRRVGGNVSVEVNIRSNTNGAFQVRSGLVDFKADSAFTEYRFSFQQDTRDDFFDPQRGALASLIVQESGLLFQSDREFLKVTGDGRWYRRVPGKGVLAFRVSGGLIIKLGATREVPNIERFFAGGMNSVRGWTRNQLGPRDLTSEETPPPVIGGESLIEGSVELRTRLTSFLGTALFLDAGNVGEKLDAFVLADLRFAAGAGLRYLSPVGPLRVDVAYRLSEDPFVGRRQIHISLGQAF